MKHLFTTALAAGLLLTPALAWSAPRTHDGFYLRASLGFGSLSVTRDGSVSGQGSGAGLNAGQSTIDGPTGTSELSIGGSLSPGLALYGMGLRALMPDATVEYDGGETALPAGYGLWLLGIGLDWFPDPKGGFHAGGGLALAAAGGRAPDGSPFENIGGAGGAVTLAVGYDFWIADEWSLGINARLVGASAHGETTERGLTAKEDDSVRFFGLYVGVLYH